MKNLLKIVLYFGIGVVYVFAEPSVYGGGNEGFYSPQKAIVKNKQTIASLQRKIAQQKEQIDGLKSIVEGLSDTVHELQEGSVAISTQANGKDNTALLKELGTMIDKINSDYVSKNELQKALKTGLKNNSSNVRASKKTYLSDQKNILKDKSTKVLYREGVRLFLKKRYDEAKRRFVLTETKGYKIAASNYYLGEIAYYTKQYEDAIFYFKKSAGLYDKASYIDVLLLHTAISLEKNGQKEQAKAFYENIVVNYNNKKSATIAKQNLKHL